MILTLVFAASVAYLLIEIFWRRLDRGDSEAVATVLAVPFVNRPELSRADQTFAVDLERIRSTGKKNIRFVNPLKPWDDPRYSPVMQPQLEYAGGLILMPNGKEWREARSLFERSFTSPAVRSYVPLLNDLRDIFMDQLEKNRLANLEEGFDIQPVIMRFTFDVIIRLVFGEDIGAQTGEEGRKIMKAWETWFSATGLLMLLNILLWPSAWKYLGGSLTERTKTGKKVIYDLIQRGIDRCRAAEKKERVSMLDNTLRHEKLPDFMKSDDEIKRQFTTLLFAGHDTTAGTTTIALHFLAHNPKWQVLIRQEVLQAIGNSPVSLEPLEPLPILNAVIKETLRVLPVAPSGGTRYIFEDFEVPYVDAQDGKQKVARFRKGDFVQPFIYGAQHDPFYWSGPHPDVWEPQRWLDDPTAGGAKNLFANNPFGNGSRRCIGEKLALGETRLLLASILRKYDVKPGEYKFVAKNEATVSAKFGVKVKLTPVE